MNACMGACTHERVCMGVRVRLCVRARMCVQGKVGESKGWHGHMGSTHGVLVHESENVRGAGHS
jgi:hypothetical protein